MSRLRPAHGHRRRSSYRRRLGLQTLELRRVLVGGISAEEVILADFGDAPDSYQTLLASNGPQHPVGTLTLGATVDQEAEGQPSVAADGDGSDEDGVRFLTSLLSDANSATIAALQVTVSGDALLDAWIDFDGNGQFDTAEHLGGGSSLVLREGANILSIDVPAGAVAGATFARFRVSTDGNLLPGGEAIDGEVEDYAVNILDGSTAPVVDIVSPGGPIDLSHDNGELVVQRRTRTLFRAPAAAVGRYQIMGDEFSNVLTIDNNGGPALPEGGFAFDGVDRVNTVRLIGPHPSLDLSAAGNVALQTVAVIDIADSSNTVVTFDSAAARAMDPRGGGIIVVGSPNDSIVFADGPQWRMSEPVGVAAFSFNVVTLNDTFVQVDFGSGWQNLAQPGDINNDGNVTSGDALRIINELARRNFSDASTSQLRDPGTVTPWPGIYFDQNNDGLATALDALRVINQLSRLANSQVQVAQSEMIVQDTGDSAMSTAVPSLPAETTDPPSSRLPSHLDQPIVATPLRSGNVVAERPEAVTEPLSAAVDQLFSDQRFVRTLEFEFGATRSRSVR